MSKLSNDEIAKVARLSRIELSPEEATAMVGEASSILEFVDTLQAVDTTGVEPTSQVTGLQDVWREDEPVEAEVNREILLGGVPATEDGYIKVGKVL